MRFVEDHPVRVIVADDGLGLPTHERHTFAVGRGADLQHTSGLGPWLVCWVTTAVGGDLSFTDRNPRSTAASTSFPAGDEE